MPELTEDQHRVVMEARALAFHHLSERYPDSAVALFATTCMGAVRDIMRDPKLADDLVPLINAELREVGYAVVPMRKN
jgi:hypothetical protein